MIRALVFDFDGLILDTETPLIDAYAEVHAAHGVAFDRALFIRSVGHADYAFDPWHGFSPHADRVALETERRARKDELIVRLPVLPGVVALLEDAGKRSLRVGLASNSETSWVEPHLIRIGLRAHFEFLACREHARSPKPEPDLYKLVLNRFGLRGHEAIAFEDSHTGCLAAKRANLHVVAVPNASTAHHDFAPAHLRLNSLADYTLDALLAQFEKRTAGKFCRLIRTMRLGPYELSSNLFLSPLAGYTNLPMRLTLRELGGLGWTTTDLVNARSLLERNPTALKLVASAPEDSPFAIQLFGSVPEEMRDAAAMCEQLGAQAVDINMGCPVKKVVRIGGGFAMMTELGKTAALVRGMIEAVKIPITAKMRLGWDDENLTAPDLARVLEDVGVAAIFVHGRTRAQGFSGTVNLAGIRAVAQAVRRVPVIGNGDVTTPAAAKRMRDETGCAGVSIGRGAFYDPWIFRRTDHYLRTGELLPEPEFAERVRVLRRHFERYCDFYGEAHGARLFRKVAPWYAKRFGPAKLFKQRILTITSRAEFETALAEYIAWRAQFCDDSGALLGKYEPAPMVASFMREPGDPEVFQRDTIPVPKGPVEVW